jgi:hypothetical protein
MTKQELLDMKLHDVKWLHLKEETIMILRVLGGWTYNCQAIESSVFVPEEINTTVQVMQP